MTLADISIARPVFAWMLMISLVFFGGLSFSRLGVSQLPDVDFPVLSVQVTWEGAAPEVIESEIVDELEKAIISVEGIEEISSSVRQGSASLSIQFTISRDIDAALQEVQAAIARIRLPNDVDPPTIRKTNPEDQPILWMGVAAPDRSLRDLIEYIEKNLKDQFEILPGVTEVVLGGFTDRSLRVWLDPKKLAKYELTVLDIRDTLQRSHLEIAAGTLENSSQEANVRVMGEGATPEEVSKLRIANRGGRPIVGKEIYLADVARVEDGLADVRRLSRVNGVPAVGLGIKKERGSNAVEVGRLVREKMVELSTALPPDMTIGINFDSTVFIEESVKETEFTLLLSAIITGIVCWLFLGSFGPTFNILLSIPTSIIGTFIVMHALGYTLNMFTILGLALAVGIVVDDAIMVLENIYRHRDMGKSRVAAARDGAREINFAAVAATVAVVAIFFPIVLVKGVIGKFLAQFGVTITVAVLLSLLEAVTLIPMRCAEFMAPPPPPSAVESRRERLFAGLVSRYHFSLGWCLDRKWRVTAVGLGIFLASLLVVPGLRKEFIPPQDQGTFIVRFETAVGSSLEYTSNALRQAEREALSIPEIRRIYVAVGGFGGGEVNTGLMFVSLHPRTERTRSQSQIMQEIRTTFGKIPGVRAFVQDLSTRGLTPQRGFPVELSIRGPNWGTLADASASLVEKLQSTGLVVDVNTDYRVNQPEIKVWPLREEAWKRGVSVEAIAQVVQASIGGIRVGKFSHDGRRYDTRIRLEGSERIQASDISALNVRNIHGEIVPLAGLVRIEESVAVQTVTRKNRERAISVYANVADGKSQSEALATAERLAQSILPPGYHAVVGGGAQSFRESFESLTFVLWIGLIVAYMVLASQFNSFLHPIAVLLSMPFSLSGAFVALWLADYSLNLFSMIGLILLMGIVKKNAIMLVEFANQLRERDHLSVREALLSACPLRIRPILMTSVATLAAAVPPALALGPGAESRIPMAITILGGVLVSTVFSLYVVPCAYSILSKFERHTKFS